MRARILANQKRGNDDVIPRANCWRHQKKFQFLNNIIRILFQKILFQKNLFQKKKQLALQITHYASVF